MLGNYRKIKSQKRYFGIILAVFVVIFHSQNAKAASYDFYVDGASIESAEDGSLRYPFKTISAALTRVRSESLDNKNIFVKNGTYPESISLSWDVKLIGESKSGAVIDADGKDNAVNFSSTNSILKNLTVRNAERTNVIIDKKSKVTIQNCVIEKAGNFGVEVKESFAKTKYSFTLKDSRVSDSGSQGLYISRRKVSLTDNEISANDEEGIDLHQGVKGKISGNNIHGNGESGIESILSGAYFSLRSNKIENNHTQGITVQAYSVKKGKISISRNTIKGNSKYGIRFANYTHSIGPTKFKVFIDKYVKKSKNTLKDNGEENIYYE